MNSVAARAMPLSAGHESGPGPGPEPIANDVPDPTSSAGPCGQLQNASNGPPDAFIDSAPVFRQVEGIGNANAFVQCQRLGAADDDDGDDGSILMEDFSADGIETSSSVDSVNGIDTSLNTGDYDDLQSSAFYEEPGQPDHVMYEFSPDDETIEWFIKAAKCTNQKCALPKCWQAKNCLFIMERTLTGDLPVTTLTEYFKLLYRHSNDCDEERCDVPCCFIFNLFDCGNFEDTMARIRRAAQSDIYGEWCLPDLGEKTVLLRDGEYSFESDSLRLDFSPIGVDLFRSNTRITATGSLSILPPEFVEIKQYHSLLDEEDQELWRSMGTLSPESKRVIAHPILVEKSNFGSVITSARLLFTDEVSLERMLSEQPAIGLPMQQVWKIADDLTAAVMYLRQAGVLFLSWTADSVVLENVHYQLCDFTCAIALSSIQGDEENIDIVRRRLPGYIIPPEMFANEVDEGSEIWGLGCLIHHIITGKHLHYNITNDHQSSNDVFEIMRDLYSDEENIARMRVSCHELGLLRQVFTVRRERTELQQVITYVKEQLKKARLLTIEDTVYKDFLNALRALAPHFNRIRFQKFTLRLTELMERYLTILYKKLTINNVATS